MSYDKGLKAIKMANTLRGMLRSILLQKGSDFQIGNYHVSALPSGGTHKISIRRIKYYGFSQFEVCVWNTEDKEITISNGDICHDAEVIYILRTIQSIHYPIEKVYVLGKANVKEDVTFKFKEYL